MTLIENIKASALAGALSSILTHPMDVLKTNFMVHKSLKKPSYKDIIFKLHLESGIKAYTRGICIRTLHMVTLSIILLCGYEQILNFCMTRGIGF